MTTEFLITRRMSGQTVAMDSHGRLVENEQDNKTWPAFQDLDTDINEQRMAFTKKLSPTLDLN